MKQTAALIGINILLLIAIAFAANTLIISARDLRFDFYPHYVGGRAVWQGDNPYNREITEQIQMGMFGQLLPPEADQQNMAYPAYASVVLAPVIAFPAKTAIALWMALQFCAILWTPVIWLQILEWKPALPLMAVLMLGILFIFRYPMDLFVLGQFSGTVLLTFSIGVWLLMNGYDRLAGGVLALTTIPPTVGLPLALAVLVAYGLRERRWHGLIAFIVTLTVLIGISMILIGNWIPDYIDILRAYSGYAEVVWAVQVVGGLPLQIIFGGALLLLALWVLWRYLTKQATLIELTITALIISLLLIPQTGEYNLVLLIPALMACLAGDNTPRSWLVRISCIVLMISPWLYARGENATLPTLLVPLHMLITWAIANDWLRFPAQRRSSVQLPG